MTLKRSCERRLNTTKPDNYDIIDRPCYKVCVHNQITRRQAMVLDVMIYHKKESGFYPTSQIMSNYLGISKDAILKRLKQLKRRRIVTFIDGYYGIDFERLKDFEIIKRQISLIKKPRD